MCLKTNLVKPSDTCHQNVAKNEQITLCMILELKT